MRIAFFSTKSYDKEFFKKTDSSHKIVFYETALNKDTANLTKDFDCVCAFVNDKINKEVIKELKENGVKLIALRCAGFNNVDLQAAKEANIKVVRVPAYSPHAVAEHAVSMLLTLNRKTHKAYNRIRENNFSLERLTGFDLYEKTVGVIGTGLIGSIFCKIMLGFGCKVIAHDLFPNAELAKAGVIYTELDSLLSSSNIISLHCPLMPETKYIINKSNFDKMKNGVMLINTSRGGLINTKDAIAALKSKKLGYLGIDVYEQEEKLFFNDLSEVIIEDDLIARLMSFPNVLITSHQGFFTKEALQQIASITLQNISDIENGKACDNEIA